MDAWRISGGETLEGACFVQGSKNASLPILAATLLSPCRSELSNVPRLRDVEAALRILRSLGCRAGMEGNDVYVDSTGLCRSSVPPALMEQMRSSVIFMGALLARCGEAELSLPGGCQLGKRPIDLHLSALRQLGAEIDEEDGLIRCRAGVLRGCELDLPFPSVGATENIMLTASRAEGETVLRGAAREPEIVALQEFLRSMGVELSGAGTDRIVISGMKPRARAFYRVRSDRIVAATLCCAAAACGGHIELRGLELKEISPVLYFLNAAGCDIIKNEHVLGVRAPHRLRAVGSVSTAPYPGFPTDAQPVLMAALLKARGTTRIHETIFEKRYRQVPELIKLGAQIRVRGSVAEIEGVERLHGARMEATDLRGGAAMLLAALSAEGESLVLDRGHITRGYESFDRVLRGLGARLRLETAEPGA